MKRLITFVLLLATFIVDTKAQSPSAIKQQAQLMVNAYMRADYATLAKFTYPRLVTAMGGQQGFIRRLTKGMNEMKAEGFTFKEVTVGDAGPIYHAGTELHSLVPQTVTLKTKGGTLVSTSHLLAISEDKGKSWSFVDAGKLAGSNARRIFPNFNDKLVIPPASKPVFHED